MSVVVIENPYEGTGFNACASCLEIQLTSFRNSIKEQWNAAINDGKLGKVYIPFTIASNLPWQEAITCINGTDLCTTHMFIRTNVALEQKLVMENAPKLEMPTPQQLETYRKV